MKIFIKLIILALTFLLFSIGFCQAHNGKTAYAIPISGITIDGKLDDWPKNMEIYSVEGVDPGYGNPIPPSGPDDFSTSFRIGYNLKANVLYIAVVVRDEDVVVHPDAPEIRNQDVCGIYIDAEKIENIQVPVFELTRLASSLGGGMIPSKNKDILVKMRLWVGKKDFLIRKVEFELDMEQFAEELSKEQQALVKGMKYFISERHTHIKLNPEFSEEFFAFVPPKEANLVENIGPSRPIAKESQLIGKPAPDFIQNDINGNPVSLSSKIGLKLLLIDFWAGWCAPCRRENPNVLKTYNEFNKKGFDVIGVSLDRTKEDWVKAINDDKLPWTQVSDLNYFNSTAAKLYNVTAIPANFLLNEKGTIIAVNLRGETLYNRIKGMIETGSVTDIDGNIYNTVTIGAQVWMVETLKATKYNDGTSIPLVIDSATWTNLKTPGYCYYSNDLGTYKATFGALYNWYTVNTGNYAPKVGMYPQMPNGLY
jgi:peroxiredoxin